MIYINPANNTLMRYAYTYDAAGNITVKNTEHGTYNYGYDIVDRLTSATYPTAQEAFAYDKVGNRIKHNNGSPWAYNANNELTSRPAISYQYDANGSQIQKTEGTTVTDYIYDGSNRLSKVKQGATTLASYAYDPFGRRISKTVNGTTTYYYYSDEGLAAEAVSSGTNGTGAITQTYGYAPNSIWGTDPIYTKAGGSYHYYLNDHLGTPQQLALKNGAKTWSAVYEAFGKATVTTATATATATITNNLRFPGQYADSETGLHYNWNRTYDNQIGRYTKADPIGLFGGFNVYSYGLNNSLLYIDPYGLYSFDEFIVDSANVSAGFGDTITFGGTDWIRNQLGSNSAVNKCSGAYSAGKYSGYAWWVSTALVGGLNGGANSVFWAGYGTDITAARLGTTIGKTPIGRFANSVGLKNRKAWDFMSSIFARNAKGNAQAVIRYRNPVTTWNRVEKPILDRRGIPIVYR